VSRAVVDVERRSVRDRTLVPVPRGGWTVRAAPRGGNLGRALRFARTTVLTFVATAALALLVGLTIPSFFGFHNFTVMSGSMEPTVHTGDVVIDRRISPLDARVGDIVSFQDPSDHSKLITHRVRSIVVKDGTVTFTTKGDAVNAVQTWSVPANGHIGQVVAHLWHLGYLLWWVSRPWGRILLVVIPVLLLGGYEIKRIWAPDRDEDDAEPA